jgi:hypothetical protein
MGTIEQSRLWEKVISSCESLDELAEIGAIIKQAVADQEPWTHNAAMMDHLRQVFGCKHYELRTAVE